MVRITRVTYQESDGDYRIYKGQRVPADDAPSVYIEVLEETWLDGDILCPDCSSYLTKEVDEDYGEEDGTLTCGGCGSVFGAG